MQLHFPKYCNVELPTHERNGHVILCSVSNPDLFWNCSRKYGGPNTSTLKSIFSLYPSSLNEDIYSKLTLLSMLLMHVISRQFNTFAFIFIQLYSATNISAWTLPLNQLMATYSFRYPFQNFKDFRLFCQHLKWRYENILTIQPSSGEDSCLSGITKHHNSPEISFLLSRVS